MRKKALLGCAVALCMADNVLADTTKREAMATRIEQAPKLDGVLDDAIWQETPELFYGQFTQLQPNNLELSEQKSKVWVVYNDFGVYIAAQLYDPDPEQIPRELGIRDNMDQNTDIFTFALDPYQNGQNGFHFLVTAAGVQGDSYITNQDNEDFGWDAVWSSAVKINEEGWAVEMEIPYSAIRFPKQDAQNWNVNFGRQIRAKQEVSFWNPIDNSQNGFVTQFGSLKGIENIIPPPRIFLTPYVTAYARYNGETGQWGQSLSGGVDLKAGLNESFTLDMVLIPDFGQVKADNQILNLGPFEVRFQENRPFFTEGTELFNQGSVFYSRRVGRTLGRLQEEISDVEEVTYSPNESPLINATKISGRTPDGWGFGFFNAITGKTFATVEDTETGDTRQVQVDPLVNYNVLVGEKTFGHNSKFTLINTNVTRFNYNRDANAIRGNLSYFLDEGNTYQVNAGGTWSRIDKGIYNTNGFAYNASFSKVSGNFQFSLGRNVESDSLDLNDMGFLQAPNEFSHYANFSINKFKPWFLFNNFRYAGGTNINQMYHDRGFTNRGIWNNIGGQLKNFWYWEAWGSVRPFNDRDYFGTFTPGRFVERPANYDFGTFIGTDSRKMVRFSTNHWTWARPSWDQRDFGGGANVRLRLSNRFNVNMGVDYNIQGNQRGFATHWEDATGKEQIIYGRRDWRSLENSMQVNYTFNNKMGINLSVRHYWARVQNFEMMQLLDDGTLGATDYTNTMYEYRTEEGELYELDYLDTNADLVRSFNGHDKNFNAFNVYLTYNWQIGPGSFVRVVYQDVLSTEDTDAYIQFMPNFRNATSAAHNQSVSVRLIYFLDYLQVRNLF